MSRAKREHNFVAGLTCPECHGRLRYTTATYEFRPLFQCVACAALYTCKLAVWAPFKPHAKSTSPGVIADEQ